jgi:uncharacterized protein (TIGR00369 family)
MSKRPQIPFPIRIPFVEQLGLELHCAADGQAEIRVDLAEAHLNSWDVAHGGVLMTMLDVAMAQAARSMQTHAPVDRAGVATIEMKTSFVRPAEGELRAVGKLLHRTSTLAFCEASVFDGGGQLCAHATGTFKYLRALPSSKGGAKLQRRTTPTPE